VNPTSVGESNGRVTTATMERTGGSAPATVLDLTGEATPLARLVGDLWRGRRLLPMLAAKDFHSRYRSASLGVLWSVFLPLVQGAVIAVVFTRVVRVSTGVSYPVFVVSGIVTWSYFSQSLTAGSTAIVDASDMAGKVYFPRLILAGVPALANMVSFAISSAVILILMGLFGVTYQWTLVLLPAAMFLALVLSILISAITMLAHVYFRDVRYIVQATLLVALYATPIIYPLEKAHSLRPLLVFGNPMTGIIQLTRFAVFGKADSLGVAVAVSCAYLVALTLVTLVAYRRHERIAVDRL
jgi:lipopolysaccharide transport system permease protein